MSENLNQLIGNIQKLEGEKRRALRMLLDEQKQREGHLLALGARMGRTTSYIASAKLEWVAQKVGYAADLPILAESVDKDAKHIKANEITAGNIQQRRPDWRRQLQMSVYLSTRHHKFPPLLVVAYQNWVYDETADQWGAGGKARRDSITAIPLDHHGAYCDLDVGEDTHFYALDGQHRLMAIQGLHDIVKKGQLMALTEDRKPKGNKSISLQQVVDFAIRREGDEANPDIVRNNLLGVMSSERVGIEIIPAVAAGETFRESVIRLRSVFVDVNERARKPTKSESILLDERNGFRMTAVRVMVNHDLLKAGEKGEKVDLKKPDISESGQYYTSLQALADISRLYLGQKEEFTFWRIVGDEDAGYVRPSDSELDRANEALSAYFDALARIPSHLRFIQGAKASEIRANEDNILFRPVAQVALAEACAELEREYGVPMDSIVEELTRQEENGQMKLKDPKSPWFGVLCDPATENMRRHDNARKLCTRMFVYLLGGGISDPEARKDLRGEFADARRIEPLQETSKKSKKKGNGPEKSYALSGAQIAAKDVRLPNPWR